MKPGDSHSPDRRGSGSTANIDPLATDRLSNVNPLNWQRDAFAPACATKGVASLPNPLPELTGATCQGSLIVVPLSALAVGCRFNDLLTLFGSYHHFDYDLL